jgi:hypothetical protein
MASLESTGDGKMNLTLEAEEATLLADLVGGMSALLYGRPDGHPVIARLFPAASDDAAEAKAYSDLVGDELLKAKLEALDLVEKKLEAEVDNITLERSDFDPWLRVLNDIRLAMGVAIDVTETDMETEFDNDDPKAATLWTLDWLAWMQSRLLDELMKEER